MALYHSGTRAKVWTKTGGKCWYCGTQTIPFSTGTRRLLANKDFCIDHVLPRSRGGDDELENLVPACWTCNNRKRNMTVEEFRRSISRYHGLALTREHAEYRRKEFGFGDYVSRLIFHFETLQTSDEEKLKQGADELFYFRDPSYLTKNDDKVWRRYEREQGIR
jgi:hypothetical protein